MGTKVLKIYEDLVQHCAINGFEVLGSYWVFTFEKKFGQIALIFSSDKLPESIEHQGPPLSAIESCKKFKLAHREDSVFIKNNRLYSIIKRKYTLPKNFLADIITQSFIMSRVQSIKIDKIISK